MMKRKCKGCGAKANKYHAHPFMCDSCVDIYAVHHNRVGAEMRSLYQQELNFKFGVPGSGIRGYTLGGWIDHEVDTSRFCKKHVYSDDETTRRNAFTRSFTLNDRTRILYMAKAYSQNMNRILSAYDDDPDALQQIVEVGESKMNN